MSSDPYSGGSGGDYSVQQALPGSCVLTENESQGRLEVVTVMLARNVTPSVPLLLSGHFFIQDRVNLTAIGAVIILILVMCHSQTTDVNTVFR